MKQDSLQGAEKYTKARQRKKRWYRVMTGLACVVVFCTVYALILPAITMENGACEIPEHTHSEACYTQVTSVTRREPVCTIESLNLHQHDDTCYDSEGNLTCGYADFVVHRHDSACYDENGSLWCPLPEIETHTHTESCYAAPEATAEIHTHTDDCYTVERGELICTESTEPAHKHTDGCYEQIKTLICDLPTEPAEEAETAEPELICEKPEIILHEHTADCFDDDGNLICGKIQVLEHQHTDACFKTVEEPVDTKALTCTLPEDENHTHGPLCYGTWELTCGMEEHTHSEVCAPAEPETEYICGKEPHTHGAACFNEASELICGLAEHVHTDGCKPSAEEETFTELTFGGPDYTVLVQYGPDAALPEGVTLAVSEIPVDSEEYQDYLSQAADAMEKAGQTDTVVFARFFDIRFLLEGETLEPAAPVSVTITYTEPVESAEDANCQAIHFAEAGPEILDVTTEQKEDGSTSFTHTQNGFSVVGNVIALPADYNSTDVGPDSLPVDYYVCIDGEWVCVGTTKTGWYYNWDGTEGWTNYNRDYITVEQAVSILGPYGFTGNEGNPSRVTAYQQKSSNTNVYSDTDTVTVPKDEENGTKILPLSRNSDHAGYNLYYLPNNSGQINGVASPESLDKSANGFYTVKVYDAQGTLLTSEIVKTGESFSYDATESGVTDWLVAYGSGSTGTISGGTITLTNITSTVTVSPKSDADPVSHSVTFKVMIDGQWQTVGSLPYYYSGAVNGSNRAYITSDMAAQFFGDFGYTAATDPGYHFGYSYNDIYTLFYANGSTRTNFCMDVAGGTLAEAQVVQLYTSNGSDAQTFRIWDAGNGYSFITPIGNSAFHVNVYGYSTGDPSSTQLKLSTATNANSQWKVDTGSDGRTTFWSALAPEDQVIDLNNNEKVDGGKLQVWHSYGGARYWYMVQQYRISNNTASERNADGTWNIGLTTESNGDIVCYYLPWESQSTYSKAAESAISTNNSFWSVSVRDDTHTVYSEGELSGMVQYVAPGGEATVTVRNADGILWSCTGASNVTATQSGGYTTFVISSITGPVEVVATKANPSFTVQYYANIPRFATSGSNPLTVIDTSGKVLPTNGGSMATRNIFLEGTGQYTSQNNGDATQLYRVATVTELTKMYSDGTYHYQQSPGLPYFNKLKDNESYTLKEIWVLKSGKDAASTNRDDWTVYAYSSDTAFTNEASQAVGNTILINDGAVIRLVSDTSTDSYYNGTTFYDYDISSGYNAGWRTGITGINIEGNYGTSSNGQKTWRSGSDILAFGNANCGTGMSGYWFDGGPLNKWNGTNTKYTGRNTDYGGATFGLAAGLNEDGTIRYNEWIVVPKLFNEQEDANKPTTGKQTYAGSSLTFDRVGDTYTLSAATLKKYNGSTETLSGLQYFFNPSPYAGKTWSSIFTNNFWPMDSADNPDRKDANWGQYGNTGVFEGYTETNGYDWSNLSGDFPAGDDGRAHNWFFGMNFAISFNLTADYVGPLEYYFFGDDDLWVFLDETLVCDIGGVHSSIGEYVNLWDYLSVGSSGQHTLTFFYTERGASGSTCYMSFTLPSVSSAITSQDTGSLEIEKTLEQTGNADFSGEEYQFRVELLTSENGSALGQTFSYSRSDGTYGTIKSGGTIALKQNESVTISGIPAGTFYRVTELSHEGYYTTVNGNEGYIVSGTIETGVKTPASFVNMPYHELPNTGGAGTYLYTIGGAVLMALAMVYFILKRRREAASS